MSPTLIVARKEISDHLRDRRSLVSAILFATMGPMVGILVLLSGNRVKRERPSELVAMMSVFALVSVFVGGMGVALDMVAGERERRSLVPLMMNPVRRIDLLAGKWLAVSAFGAGGLWSISAAPQRCGLSRTIGRRRLTPFTESRYRWRVWYAWFR